MKTRLLTTCFAVMAVVVAANLVADEDKPDLEGITCPVSNKAVNADVTADYREGRIFLCCPGCVGPFEEKTEKFSTKANMQLVATKQVKQVNCPISGHAVNDEVTSEVGGVTIGYCCKGCKGKVNKAEGDDQLALVFSNEAFENGFAFSEEDEG